MIGLATRVRAAVVAGACAAFVVLLCAAPARSEEPTPTEYELLKAKCSLCHNAHRAAQMKPEEIRPVLERMRKMNPDWITQTDSDHIAEVIAKLLGSPSAIQARQAWEAAVERGRQLFTTPELGTTGKSCFDCHGGTGLRNVEEAYPKFDPDLKRFVDLSEAINRMIQTKMNGVPLPPNDQRYIELLSYIKSL